MRERGRGRRLITACLAMLALVGTMVVWGCKKAEETGAAGAGTGAGAAAGEAAGGRRVGRRRGGGRAARWGETESSTTGGTAPGGSQAAAAPPPVAPPPAKMSDEERAKRIREFAKDYGPLTLAYEKNWDGRILEWVMFSHKGQNIKMPLSMVLDAAKTKNLEGYFVIYPASGSPGKGTVTYKITATSAVPPPPKQPETKAPPPPSEAAVAAAAAAAQAPATAGAQGGGQAGGRGGGRGGRMGGSRRGG